jgi:hypothetical protein
MKKEKKYFRVAGYVSVCLLCVSSFIVNAQSTENVFRMIEIRSYNLKPGTRNQFHKLFVEQALPMLERWKVEVVSYGPSLHDEDSYFLMRAYSGLEVRQKSQDAFYGSDEWKQGPRESILTLIVNYTTVVVSDHNLKAICLSNTCKRCL